MKPSATQKAALTHAKAEMYKAIKLEVESGDDYSAEAETLRARAIGILASAGFPQPTTVLAKWVMTAKAHVEMVLERDDAHPSTSLLGY